MPEFDPAVVRALLGSVMKYREALGTLSTRAGVTVATMDSVRTQAAPHPVNVAQVKLHEPCSGRGCPFCALSGVVNAATGQPFSGPPPTAVRSAAPAPAAEVVAAPVDLETERRAIAQLCELARLFRHVAGELESAHRHALELARFFDRLV